VSLTTAVAVQGDDFVNWKDLVAASGPAGKVLLVAKIREYSPVGVKAEGGFNGTNYPVTIDVLVCSGPSTGQAYLNQSVIGRGMTRTLRGQGDNGSIGAPCLPPIYPLNTELPLRLALKGSPNQYPILDPATPEETTAILAVHSPNGQDGHGWVLAAQRVNAPAPAPAYVAPAPVATPLAPAPVAAGPSAEELAAWRAAQAQQAQPAETVGAGVGGAVSTPPWHAG
jgi:hypothetical protein